MSMHQEDQCHQENGGTAAHNLRKHSRQLDRLLMGFSANSLKIPEHFLELKIKEKGGIKGFSMMEGCSNIGQEEEVDNSATGAACSKLISKKNGENPNGSCKKVENEKTKICVKGHWKPPEDAKLRELVAVYGPQNWNLIAEKLQEGRSGKSCRLRWYNQLDPKINKRAFTKEEDERLMEAHGVYGSKWALISRFFPGRTDNALKNQWHVLTARKCRENSKSYIKRKWAMCTSQPAPERRLMEENAFPKLQSHRGEELFGSNYYNYISGISCVNLYSECTGSWNTTREREESRNHMNFSPKAPYSPGSTSQISFAAPSSPSPSVADQPHFLQSAASPAFIDFLGVGGI